MNRFFGLLLILAAGMLAKNNDANAGIIVGNGNINDPSFSLSGRSFLAHDAYGKEFSVSADATARGASILLATDHTSTVPTTGTFNVALYNLGSTPGSTPSSPAIASAQVIASFTNTNQGKWFHVDFGNGVSLVTTSYYLFAVERVSGVNDDISWEPPANYASYSGGTVSGDFLSRLNGGSYTNAGTGPSFGFQLTTQAVPEPSSAAIALLLMGAGALRRFRKAI